MSNAAVSNTVLETLRSLERSDGRLLPATVVEAAKDPSSPLHSHFEWDDTAAAAKYRIDQARALIRSVKIEVTVRDVPLTVVAYVRDPTAEVGEAGYRNVVRVRSEEDSARAVIVDEMKRVTDAVKRARSLAALLGVQEDLEAIGTLARQVSNRANGQQPSA